MLNAPIGIRSLSSISAKGTQTQDLQENHALIHGKIGSETSWVGALPNDLADSITQRYQTEPKYRHLDKSVLYALWVAREAYKLAGWTDPQNIGVNFGSSRGATALFEAYFETFTSTGKVPSRTSPTSTLGNISSWVSHDLQLQGPAISHSITCSTALHALLNACAWLQSGMSQRFIVGGSEAALTPFTLAQMKALKIYSRIQDAYPSRPLDFSKTSNTMVLGEGAAAICLDTNEQAEALAWIQGIGFATEPLTHNVSISTDAQCFQQSMRMAIKGFKPSDIDGIVMHAPGTIQGDLAEYEAIKTVFRAELPALTSNKWNIGHTFGPSGLFSLELAIDLLKKGSWQSPPYLKPETVTPKKILVNAVGFGGNAVSILVSKEI